MGSGVSLDRGYSSFGVEQSGTLYRNPNGAATGVPQCSMDWERADVWV